MMPHEINHVPWHALVQCRLCNLPYRIRKTWFWRRRAKYKAEAPVGERTSTSMARCGILPSALAPLIIHPALTNMYQVYQVYTHNQVYLYSCIHALAQNASKDQLRSSMPISSNLNPSIIHAPCRSLPRSPPVQQQPPRRISQFYRIVRSSFASTSVSIPFGMPEDELEGRLERC